MAADGIRMAATKLRAPSPPRRLVDRTRLAQLLDRGIVGGASLLLVSAPAGSGKSTLVAAWAASRPEAVAWLQVEDGDSDPAGFWSFLVAAIGRCVPDVAAAVGPLVIGSQGHDRVVVPAIVNAVAATGAPLIVVVDDYHLIDDADVHRGVERLVELAPAGLTLVLCTRVDPPFRLGRMRVRNRVAEVRAQDLRFEIDEARALLGPVGGALLPERLDELCVRTEGWAAGLVLAGLSMERAPDPDRFVDAFRGDDQLVVSYLSDELLATMTPADRRRLVETAVLDHLTGPLIDAVTGSSDGTHWLADLAGRNQLVIGLDTTGEWFRHHHLLHDLLALEARRAFPDRLPELHGRAADWFAASGDHAHAVVHQLAAGHLAGAIRSMHHVGPDLLGRGQVKNLRSLLDKVGPDAADDAGCSLLWGWCEYLASRYVPAQRWLDRSLELAPPELDRMVFTPLQINVALGSGDVAAALTTARLVTETDDLWHRPAELATAVGAAFTWAGRSAEADGVLAIAVARSTTEQRFTAHVLALVAKAINLAEQGASAAAFAAAEQAIATAESFGLAGYHGVAPAFAVRARTTTDVDGARADVERAIELARRAATDLGRAYVLITCGDTLLDAGDQAGAALVVEARASIDRCVDPGIAGRYLSRVESRHRLRAATVEPNAGVGQLTERELAVLRYLPTQLSQRDIAAELFMSLNTVKTHCGAIFRKLEVGDRKAAVQAARDRDLL